MSPTTPKLTQTNLRAEDMVMDDRVDGNDPRYYCLPPYYGDPGRMSQPRRAGGGYVFHLVSQGHQVGIFDSWLGGGDDDQAIARPQAQASLTGFPECANRGYHSITECINTWQGLCVLGIHPHPVDPEFTGTPSANAAAFVNTSPRKLRAKSKPASPVKAAASEPLLQAHPSLPTQPEPDKTLTCAAEQRRVRLGLPPVKPGKIGWVHGTKLTFLEGFQEQFLAAAEIKRIGAFYSAVAKKYLEKYGYNTPWEGDLKDGQTVADDVNPDEDINSLSKEEGEARAKYYHKLRNPELDPPQLVKARTLHYYSRRFYEERVKPRFVARWAVVSRLPNPPPIMTLRNKVTREAWEAESDEFKAEVLAAREAEHQRALNAYSMAVSAEAPTTAEEYNVGIRALNNATYYLQPFADSAHERFGMNVVILMCGLVPDRGGRIEVRSIHSGKSNGLVPRIWAESDRTGFDAAQRSFIEFSHQCFTEAECRARSLNGIAMGDDEAGPSSNDAATSSSNDHPTSPSPNDGQTPPSANDASTSPPTNNEPTSNPPAADQDAAQPSQPDATSQGASISLRYDPLDPQFDALLRLDFGLPSGANDFELEGSFGSGFGGGFGGFGGGLGGTFGEQELPPLNLRNRDEEEEEVARDKSPSQAATAPPPPPPLPPPPNTRPKPKPAYRRRPAAGPAQDPPPEPAEREGEQIRNGDDSVNRSGEDGAGSEGGSMWQGQEKSDWPEELQKAFTGFARGKAWGGEEWEHCVTELLTLESVWGFPNKGLLAVLNSAEDRPSEIEKFMRYGRKWGPKMELGSAIGPCALEESFANRWWAWWAQVQPKGRKLSDGVLQRPDKVAMKEWEDIGKMAGRNGVLLYVGGLLWWGEAAAVAPEAETLLGDWRVDKPCICLPGEFTNFLYFTNTTHAHFLIYTS
ncbi:hypothetical protein B0H13DRAFT_1904079 [Mycena leptocephala]|nr:hypothetical protein B0H13DRAFT_1904079 [Mycena leptocephala]